MSFIEFRKLSNGFPIGRGDETRRYLGREYVVCPIGKQWRVIIFDAGLLVNTTRVLGLNAAHSYAQGYIEELGHGRR